MSIKSVNISCNEVKEQLALSKLPVGWTVEANDQDTLCINTPKVELGYIVTLNMNNFSGYSFTVHEFMDSLVSDDHNEQDDSFLTYDEVLDYIAHRIECFK